MAAARMTQMYTKRTKAFQMKTVCAIEVMDMGGRAGDAVADVSTDRLYRNHSTMGATEVKNGNVVMRVEP